MRNSRGIGPPSTLSGSSGHGLVYGVHRPRGPQHAFTPESPEPVPNKRKTKLIVILGIALPVLACVIGIAAWAVTTDVLRITPRANDNNYNRFGHQGKTRIDNMQSRSDQDVDVFVLHGITNPTSASPKSSTTKKAPSSTTMSTTGASVSTGQSVISPKASDILSKLISDMPAPKNPKNFIVFAPVADTEAPQTQRKGRRFDSKVIHQDGEDLVAEESIISEDTSQELGLDKVNFNRKRKHPVGNFSLKPGMMPHGNRKMNQKAKMGRNPRILPTDQTSESPPNFVKRPPRGDYVTFPTNSNKPPMSAISNRNGGITQPRPNVNFPRSNIPNTQKNNANNFQNFDKKKITDQQTFRNAPQAPDNGQSRTPNLNFQPSVIQQPSLPTFNNQPPSTSFNNKPSSSSFNNQPASSSFNNQPASSSFNKDLQFSQIGPPTFQNKEPNIQPNQFVMDNQRRPSFTNQQNPGSSHNQFSSPQGPPPPNYPSSPQNVFNTESSPTGSGNGGPQYFAPPPQTFHTKINYDQPSSKLPSSSVSTYEKVAQSTVDASETDGTHHHHHHHHHHEPVPSNSDPIGDVNYSDVPRGNDADRLGSIGIGMGPSRGITLQIGGGGGGGALGGLLPFGTLGIARGLVSALLPRPQLGLNSKVFLGVEVGRGGGLSVGLG